MFSKEYEAGAILWAVVLTLEKTSKGKKHFDEFKEAVAIATDCLNYRTPKYATILDNGTRCCPVCGNALGKHFQYCDHCGQAIMPEEDDKWI